MSNDFRKPTFDDYVQENIWNKLIKMLKGLTERSRRENSKNSPAADAITSFTSDSTPNAITKNDDGKRVPKKFKTGIDFVLNEDLVYYVKENKRRICLLSSMEKNIFHLIHDENMHAGVHRSFNRITIFFIFPVFPKNSDVTSNIILIASSPKRKNTDHMAN